MGLDSRFGQQIADLAKRLLLTRKAPCLISYVMPYACNNDRGTARRSRNPKGGSPQRPPSSQRNAGASCSVLYARSVVDLFFAAHKHVGGECYGRPSAWVLLACSSGGL